MTPVIARFLLLLMLFGSSAVQAMEWLKETPNLLAKVQAGELPPVAQRVPADVQVVQFSPDQSPGDQPDGCDSA